MKKQTILILMTFMMVTCCPCKANDLSGVWNIFSIEGEVVETETEAFLQFDTQEKRVHGKAGCNMLSFAYETQENNATAIAFKQGISTRMMCIDMETEDQFLRICPEIVSFSIDIEGNTATFYDDEKDELLVLKKKE